MTEMIKNTSDTNDEFFTDTEKRLLFSALRREKEICQKVDSENPDMPRLVPVVESLERKFYYDKMVRKIRESAIKEFAEAVKPALNEKIMGWTNSDDLRRWCERSVDEIAEKLKKKN